MIFVCCEWKRYSDKKVSCFIVDKVSCNGSVFVFFTVDSSHRMGSFVCDDLFILVFFYSHISKRDVMSFVRKAKGDVLIEVNFEMGCK